MSGTESEPVRLYFGGYGPPTTTHSRGLKFIGDKLESEFGERVVIKYVWNVMDVGYKSEDTLWLAESGVLTLAYQSTSYLTDRVPELGFVDLPFLFEDNYHARKAMDGALGDHLKACIEKRVPGYRMLGFFENGFRHMSNRLRPVRTPGDLAGMSMRVLPSKIHARTFELLGAEPWRIDLTDALERIQAGTIDAQENPFANTVTYGAHTFHPYHTISSHFYVSRGLFANRRAFEALPEDIQVAFQAAAIDAVAYQRDLAVAEEEIALQAIRDAGCEVAELSTEERQVFADTVRPIHAEARNAMGPEMFEILENL